ncbi:hypothetical protein TRFO_21052 [Tritrichomonas foetus]|uniref:Protein kinase domain-containing protein n=1 Tax=Tritrichomonas foetus TaxID=1144522 RepID=A0A1J4KER9_9EUKA|nr:hypothetical protein TRFO_21052 [Tritrichomonas foetus]|eukprot:OHT09953.1 hypothetical protein TRFO_21052 [Tritrichomonas foetus]
MSISEFFIIFFQILNQKKFHLLQPLIQTSKMNKSKTLMSNQLLLANKDRRITQPRINKGITFSQTFNRNPELKRRRMLAKKKRNNTKSEGEFLQVREMALNNEKSGNENNFADKIESCSLESSQTYPKCEIKPLNLAAKTLMSKLDEKSSRTERKILVIEKNSQMSCEKVKTGRIFSEKNSQEIFCNNENLNNEINNIHQNEYKEIEKVDTNDETNNNLSKSILSEKADEKSEWKEQYNPYMKLGAGVFGTVYSAFGKDGRKVAIKKVKIDPRFVNRELEILNMIDSPFCLKLIDHYIITNPNSHLNANSIPDFQLNTQTNLNVQDNNDNSKNVYNIESPERFLCIVTELMPFSMKSYLDKLHIMNQKIDPLLMKLFFYQMFVGLDHIHSRGITHRDLKTDNILVDNSNGILKICDFGAAKVIEQGADSVSYIASRHYRAPELLVGCTKYGPPIDVWAAGCVIAEVLNDSLPMFMGSSNEDQLVQIMQVLGQPSKDEAEAFEKAIGTIQQRKTENQAAKMNECENSILTQTIAENSLEKKSKVNRKGTREPAERSKRNSKKSKINGSSLKNSKSLKKFDSSKKQTLSSNSSQQIQTLENSDTLSKLEASKVKIPNVHQITSLRHVLPSKVDPALFDLLESIFVYDPSKRPTARQCMASPYFDELFSGETATLPNGKKLPDLPRFC